METPDFYRERVSNAAISRKGKPLLGYSIDHYSAILQTMLLYARHTVRILSLNLDPSCFCRDEIAAAAQAFLARQDHQVQILVEAPLWDPEYQYSWTKNPFIQRINDFITGYEESKSASGLRIVPSDWASKYQFNFVLMDDYGFYFKADRNAPGGTVVFLAEEDPKLQIANLHNIFSCLWKSAIPIKLF